MKNSLGSHCKTFTLHTDSVMTWGPYLYTTVSNVQKVNVSSFFTFEAKLLCWASIWLDVCSLCWMTMVWLMSVVPQKRWSRLWSSSSSLKPLSCGPWLRLWWSRLVPCWRIQSKFQTQEAISSFISNHVFSVRTPMESTSTTYSPRSQMRNFLSLQERTSSVSQYAK